VEPAGSGAQSAVLPEYPGAGYGDGLPLPLPPQPPAAAAAEVDALAVPADTMDLADSMAAEEEAERELAAPGVGTEVEAAKGAEAAAAAATATAAATAEEAGEEAGEEVGEEAPDYEGEEEIAAAAEEEEEEEVPGLTYGNLNRDNVLPLARDNLDRTVGLLRAWIEQKPPTDNKQS
jgi:hypothetical protein